MHIYEEHEVLRALQGFVDVAEVKYKDIYIHHK